jgi:hypothetical protein
MTALAGFITRGDLREIATPLACAAGRNRVSPGPNTPLATLLPAGADGGEGSKPSETGPIAPLTRPLASVDRGRLPLTSLATPSAASLVVLVLGGLSSSGLLRRYALWAVDRILAYGMVMLAGRRLALRQ